MAKTLQERIQAAVQDGVAARHEYFGSIGLQDEQSLGPPAREDELRQIEARLKRQLPPSYRAFLSLYDGWKMIDGGLDLLSVSELLNGPQHAQIQEWQQQMWKAGDTVAARSLVIGVSHITPTRYLLDPETSDDGGEWQLVQHHKIVEAEVPSFLQWLEESVDEYRQLARMQGDDEDGGDDE